MSITIIECNTNTISLSNFVQKGTALSIEYETKKILNNNTHDLSIWINEASHAIKELVAEAESIFPVVLILPGFAVLTKVLQVPKVARSKQAEVIRKHVHKLLGTGKEEYLSFAIADAGVNADAEEWEVNVVCALVKKNWINAFCKALESINITITSIEPPGIHYYNALRMAFPKLQDNRPSLLVVIQGLSACCIFSHNHCTYIHRIAIQSSAIVDEIKKLYDQQNKKHPENAPQQILIAGIKPNDSDFIEAFQKLFQIPTQWLYPLKDSPSELIGSIGAAHQQLFENGLSIDMTPPAIKKAWAFHKSKKAILITGSCIAASLLFLLNTIDNRTTYYKEQRQALEAKLIPLAEHAAIINQNEKLIAFYNEGFNALESYIKSNKSWTHILNSLQTAFTIVPNGRIHSLKIIEPEHKFTNNWKNELMGTEKTEDFLEPVQLMHISGSFLLETNRLANDAIDTIRSLMTEIAKLDFIEGTQDLHFDIHNLQSVPFSFSLVLKR